MHIHTKLAIMNKSLDDSCSVTLLTPNETHYALKINKSSAVSSLMCEMVCRKLLNCLAFAVIWY